MSNQMFFYAKTKQEGHTDF